MQINQEKRISFWFKENSDMGIRLALETKNLLKSVIESDQGAAYREHLKKILPKISDAYGGAKAIPFRAHLGASTIGHECDFYLWLNFRWANKTFFDERILRLFNRGHLEEAHFIAMCKAAELEIWYETEEGGQFVFSNFGGHFGSALDAVIKIPELGNTPAYAEFKTHNDKSFKSLDKKGLLLSKPRHYAQMQVCMNEYNLLYGVYFAVNKNDDEIYIEIIERDEASVDANLKKAINIIFTTKAPKKISNRSNWWQCVYCDKKDICHNNTLPEINCRTCIQLRPMESGGWYCKHQSMLRDTGDQFLGCEKHIFNPELFSGVPLVRKSTTENYIELKLPNGSVVKHGPDHVSSKDLKL